MQKYAPARLLWMLFAVLAWASTDSLGQNFDLPEHGLRVISLDGQWRFHVGDDPAWCQPLVR